jgi:hypothetical protein
MWGKGIIPFFSKCANLYIKKLYYFPQAFPELLSPISVEKSIVQQQQQSANEQLAPSGGEEGNNNNNKFEREENGAGIEGPQQLYGATPIPAAAIGQMTEEEEALLPFKGEAEEEPMERMEKVFEH